jgi:hypothetical protein
LAPTAPPSSEEFRRHILPICGTTSRAYVKLSRAPNFINDQIAARHVDLRPHALWRNVHGRPAD